MSETAVFLWFTCLSHGQWASFSLYLTVGLWIKRLETDTPSSAECILPGPIVFKARQWLANWWREHIVFAITSRGPIVRGERQVQRSVEYGTVRTSVNKTLQRADRAPCWLQETTASNKTSWSTGSLWRWHCPASKGPLHLLLPIAPLEKYCPEPQSLLPNPWHSELFRFFF